MSKMFKQVLTRFTSTYSVLLVILIPIFTLLTGCDSSSNGVYGCKDDHNCPAGQVCNMNSHLCYSKDMITDTSMALDTVETTNRDTVDADTDFDRKTDTYTDTDIQIIPSCGNGKCDSNEDCGTCPTDCVCRNSQICYNNACCQPKTCANLGKECGSGYDDGCGGTVDCGGCDDDLDCTTNSCIAGQCKYEVVATSCLINGKCVDANTSQTDNPCYTCDPTKNQHEWTYPGDLFKLDDGRVCWDGAACTLKTCANLGKECGSGYDDGCGGTVDCGVCKGAHYCNQGKCNPLSECSPVCGSDEFCFGGTCHTIIRPVIPTNQTKCYDNNSKEIPCPGTAGGPDCGTTDFCGQDAQYPDHWSRTLTVKTIGNDDVVIDSLTGLEWQRTFVTGKKWQEAMDYCSNLNHAGHDDWHLPTAAELQTLVDYGRIDPGIDTKAFPNTPSDWFWSSLSVTGYNNFAWRVNFGSSNVGYGGKGSSGSTRCVRSGPFPSHSVSNRYRSMEYVDNQPVVVNIEIGLVWQGKFVTGKTWQEALAYCEALDYGGFDDWHLPDINELFTLVNLDNHDPASDFPGILSDWFWSSSSVAGVDYGAWYVYFESGYISQGEKDYSHDVICVRPAP